MRKPPERTPPKFKVGDRVRVNFPLHNQIVTPVLSVEEMSQEWLIRTGYAAGFYTYKIDIGGGRISPVSGNLLELALIETLGELATD